MNTNNYFSKTELELFEEIAKIISRYPELKGKYAIGLVHAHYPVSADEVLHETSDKANRVSTLSPIKKIDLPKKAFPSQWTVELDKQILKVTPITWCCD